MGISERSSWLETDFPMSEPSSPLRSIKSISFPVDSPKIHSQPPKPSLVSRIALFTALIFFQMLSWSLRSCSWVFEKIFDCSCPEKPLYRELHKVSKQGNIEKIREFLIEQSENAFAASYFFSEFVELNEIYSHLPEILKGANVCLEGDSGFFCNRWSQHPASYQRLSSHQHLVGKCYAIGHVLFWIDLEGNSRFQFENSPLKGFLSSIDHIIDFLRYRKDNEQQGVVGTSPHTEEFCLRIEIDPSEFMFRKLS